MATAPQPNVPEIDDEESYVLPPNHRLPGWTVDALLAEDKVDETRAELERLLEKGINSGLGVPMNDEFWDRLLKRAQQRASGGQ